MRSVKQVANYLRRHDAQNSTWIGVQLNDSVVFSTDFSGTGLACVILNGVRESTLRAAANTLSDFDGFISSIPHFANIIDQLSLDLTCKMFAKRVEILAKTPPDQMSLRVFADVNDVVDFLSLTKLSGKEIENFRARSIEAALKPSVFISYSTKDMKALERIQMLFAQTGCSVWFAPVDMKAGGLVTRQIDEAIDNFTYVVPVLSRDSIVSEWVAHEIIRGKRRERLNGERRVVYPVRLVAYDQLADWTLKDPQTGANYAEDIRSSFIPDFTIWEDAVELQNRFVKFARQLQLV